MLKEEKIRSLIEEELLWLEKFAMEEKTNIYRNDIVEADRRITRLSALYEVLEEVPEDATMSVVKHIKEKLQ
jgi:hypothetical protein